MDINKISQFLKAHKLEVVIVVILSFALLIGAFSAGVFIGFKKATFSYRWGDNYHQNFGGPREGFLRGLGDFGGGDFIEGNGVFGQIIKIDGQTLIIKGRDNMERIVLIKDDVSIQRFQNSIKVSDLKVDDYIVVLGSPNDLGQIEAKFIRVMPGPSPIRLPASSAGGPNGQVFPQ